MDMHRTRSRRLLAGIAVLVLFISPAIAQERNPLAAPGGAEAGAWWPVDGLTVPRTGHGMAPLPDSRVLVAGGLNHRTPEP